MVHELYQIMNGIYSINKDAKFDKEIILAVHPLFVFYNKERKHHRTKDIEYGNSLTQFLRTLDQPLITMESESKLEETISHYQDFTDYPNIFFIKTKNNDPKPSEMDYNKLVYYLDHLRKEEPIILIGGYYDPGNHSNPGCLDVIKSKLSSIPHSVHKSLTF